MGTQCSKYNERGYCIDHLNTEVHPVGGSVKSDEINQNGVVDVAASVPITIDGNLIFIMVVTVLVLIGVFAFLWKRYGLGISSHDRRVRNFQKQQNMMMIMRILEHQMNVPRLTNETSANGPNVLEIA